MLPNKPFPTAAAPPVKLFGIPARYANATYTAASKQGVLDQVETELLGFKSVNARNRRASARPVLFGRAAAGTLAALLSRTS